MGGLHIEMALLLGDWLEESVWAAIMALIILQQPKS